MKPHGRGLIKMNYGNEHINQLVIELSKSNPNADIIKSNTETLGIPYSVDIIVLMSDVLVYLSKNKNKQPTKEKLV